jgi:hypothetical protein
MTPEQLQRDLERCDREIARTEMETMSCVDPCGALLGFRDWSWERRIIIVQLETLIRRT